MTEETTLNALRVERRVRAQFSMESKMTFDDYCKETGHYAENGDRAMWDAATKAERMSCAKVCRDRAETARVANAKEEFYEAVECEHAILERSNMELTGRAKTPTE